MVAEVERGFSSSDVVFTLLFNGYFDDARMRWIYDFVKPKGNIGWNVFIWCASCVTLWDWSLMPLRPLLSVLLAGGNSKDQEVQHVICPCERVKV